ncbi:MAG: hypothetical protein F6J98_19590 [Moorea sp. SIO4G2]|nr:hypothetical protein [Moorena sp. SIO4G2]
MGEKSIGINRNVISVWVVDAQGNQVLMDAFYKTLPRIKNHALLNPYSKHNSTWLLTPE